MNIFKSKAMHLLGMTMFTSLLLAHPISADFSEAKKPWSDYLEECPWIGLVADKITLGPIKISEVSIHEGDKLAFVSPGTTLNGSLKYEVKSEDLESLHLYHLTVGIKDLGAQDCVTHNLGMWDTKGKGYFTLVAPEEYGVYEVRFLFSEGLTCDRARDDWNWNDEKPNSSATIGIIVVE